MKTIEQKVLHVDRTMLLLLVILLLVRLSMVAAYPLLCGIVPEWSWSNNDGYDTLAVNWLGSGTYALETGIPTATRLPAYPALIAVCYAMAEGEFPLMVMVVQALLSTLTGYWLFRMAENLFGRSAALATLVLFILHPQANNFVFRCATETLFTFLVMVFLHNLVRYLQTRKAGHLFWAAVWLGMSLLTRQTLAPLVVFSAPVVLLWCFVMRKRYRFALRHAVMGLAVTTLMLVPWVARNYLQSGHVPVLQTWVGQPMFQGVYVSQHLSAFLHGEKHVTDLDVEALSVMREKTIRFLDASPHQDNRPIAREVVADRFVKQQAIAALLDDPLSSIGLVLRNLVLAPVLQMTWKSTIVLMAWNWPLLILAALGALRCFRTKPTAFLHALPVTILFLYLLAVHAIVWPQARYVMSGLLPFSAFAGLGLVHVFQPCFYGILRRH